MANNKVIAPGTVEAGLFSVIGLIMGARESSDKALEHLGKISGEDFSIESFDESSAAISSRIEECCAMWGGVIEKVVNLADEMLLGEPYVIFQSGSVGLKLEDILTSVHPERSLEAISQIWKASSQDERFEMHLFGIVSIAMAVIGDFGEQWQLHIEEQMVELFSIQAE